MSVTIDMNDEDLPVVTFHGKDFAFCAQAGFMRRVEAITLGQHPAYGMDGDNWSGWGLDIEAGLGEAAVATYLDIFWGPGDMKTPDVGIYQVRTTDKRTNRLIIRPSDSPQDIFIHVTGRAPTYTIEGWIKGWDGMKHEWLQGPNGRPPAYFVPNNKLKSPKLLKNIT